MKEIIIDNLSKEEAKKCALNFLNSAKSNIIFTPNPEMCVLANRDKTFLDILNAGSLNLCDGFGIKFFSRKIKERISGADFMLDLCSLAEQQNKSIYLLGSGNDIIIAKSCQFLKSKYPNLKISGFNKGPEIKIKNEKIIIDDQAENVKIIDEIIDLAPDILLVGFGHNKQEKWIYNHISQMPSVKIAMAIGGAFDFIGGKVKRAPAFMRKIGLEWFWRLILEPKRFLRIINAVAVFSFLILLKKISIKLRYDAKQNS
jgi:N-acetylglucosaminyldiphosphoundecaprenol N-acetyl-beta-D-mannosaminyltransferase